MISFVHLESIKMNLEYKRGWLEVMKFLSPPELLSTGTVCTRWNEWSRYDEVWKPHLVVSARETDRSLREVCREQLFRPQFFVYINRQRIRLHSPTTSAFRKIKLPRDFHLDNFATWVSLPQKVFICGGEDNGNPVNDCYFVHYLTETIERLPNMIFDRTSPGLAYFYGSVYVFGGKNINERYIGMSECEKFTLATKQWTPLPSMEAMLSGFVPGRFNSSIYIAGGCYSDNSIQVFSLHSETFQRKITLFVRIFHFETSIIAFCDTLVIVSHEYLYQYSMESQQIIKEVHLAMCLTTSKIEAIVCEDFAYILSGDEICKLFKDLTIRY